jgi:Spy/CpxP family protein refolding chaperone
MTLAASRPWIILALIFLLGAVTGSLLTIGFGPQFEPPPPPGLQQLGNHWMMHLTQRLNLTGDQQAKIRPIVMDAEQQIVQAHHDDVARIGKIMQDTNARIAAELQPEQQAQLREMESERERMFQHHMHGNHGPGDFHHEADDPPPGPPPTEPVPPPPAS